MGLDAFPGIPFSRIDQGNCTARAVCPACATDAVDIVEWISRDREVDDDLRFRNVDSAARHVRADQAANRSAAVCLHGVHAGMLCFVAVQSAHSPGKEVLELARDSLCLLLFPYKHQHPVFRLEGRSHVADVAEFCREIREERNLLDDIRCSSGLRSSFYAHRPKQKLIRKSLHTGWKSCTEQDVLTLSGKNLLKLPELRHEPHVHHPVRFIEHDRCDFLHEEGFLAVEFPKPPGSGDDQVLSLRQGRGLDLRPDSSVQRADAQVGKCCKTYGLVVKLHHQFLRRGKHGSPGNVSLGMAQLLQNGQQECSGFPRARGGNSDEVRPGKKRRNGEHLDGSGFRKTCLSYRLASVRAETERGKIHVPKVGGLNCARIHACMPTDLLAHMRPLQDAEVPAAAEFLRNEVDWHTELDGMLGTAAVSELVTALEQVTSVEEFQARISQPLIHVLLLHTAGEVHFEYPEEFNAEGALFISNHRDIVLDPSLVNIALLQRGFTTTEIGIGSNLLRLPWVEKLVRLNKSFIVQRGGTPREQLKRSAEVAAYVREAVLERSASVWLAQREGRAKDGDDRTSPALIRMLLDGGGQDAWNALRVHPVCLTYEWDPCDAMKVREMLMRSASSGNYAKVAGEDERSMRLGLLGPKGDICVRILPQVSWVEGPGRPANLLAAEIDRRIHAGYVPFPSHEWAATRAAGEAWRGPEAVRWACESRLESVVAYVQEDTDFSEETIVAAWCAMTAQPWVNARAAKASAMPPATAAFRDSA